jgi:hypothetical protein
MVAESYPLVPVQQGMLFHHLEGTNVGVDIEQMVGDLAEAIDPILFERAWQRISDRHPILRTRFRWDGLDQPLQDVLDTVVVHLVVHDLRSLTHADQQEAFDRFLVDDRRRGFALGEAPPWRVNLFHLAEDRQRVVFSYHHSLLDISVVWVVEEVFQTYDASLRGQEADLVERRPYKDHVAWLQEHLAANREPARRYFHDLLDGFDEPTNLVSLERSPHLQSDQLGYGADRFRLTEELSRAIHTFAATEGISPPVLIEAAWGLVLSAFSGSSDVVFGSTRGCRRSGLPGSDRIMGLFINTPPVRMLIDPAATVRSLLEAIRHQQVEKRAYEHTPLTDVQAAMDSRAPALFDTIVVVNELHQGTRLKAVSEAFEHRHFDLQDQTNFPLTLLAYTDPQIHFKLSYDLRSFDPAAMARVQELLIGILAGMVGHPDGAVADLPKMTGHDRQLLAA